MNEGQRSGQNEASRAYKGKRSVYGAGTLNSAQIAVIVMAVSTESNFVIGEAFQTIEERLRFMNSSTMETGF